MINFEFTKPEKKIVRGLIETALQRDYEKCITSIENIILDWKSKRANSAETYKKLYKTTIQNDKKIDSLYDDQRGSTYITIILRLLYDGTLKEEDLNDLPVETIMNIYSLKKLLIDRKD